MEGEVTNGARGYPEAPLRVQTSEAGLVLVSCLLTLAFLSMVGAAMLWSASLEARIAENYRTGARLRFLAEGGFEDARELLRVSGLAPASWLVRAAGPDGRLDGSVRIESLLASDDRPVLPVDPALRAMGVSEPATFGQEEARVHVFLRNDLADGAETTADTNGVVTLVSIARLGSRRHRVEADLRRSRFPTASALTVSPMFGITGLAETGDFRIEGGDRCGRDPVHAIGVVDPRSAAALGAQIPGDRETRYTGAGPVPDVVGIGGRVPAYLTWPPRLEEWIAQWRGIATETLVGAGTPVTVGPVGSAPDPHILVVEGDAVLGPGTGYGVLIVRGEARIADGFAWNGLVLVVGEGILEWAARGTVNGAVLVARTREPVPGDPEPVARIDLTGAEGGIYYDGCAIDEALGRGPLFSMEVRDY